MQPWPFKSPLSARINRRQDRHAQQSSSVTSLDSVTILGQLLLRRRLHRRRLPGLCNLPCQRFLSFVVGLALDLSPLFESVGPISTLFSNVRHKMYEPCDHILILPAKFMA